MTSVVLRVAVVVNPNTRDRMRDRIVGPFRSIRVAESWARTHAFDSNGYPLPWHVEPLQSPATAEVSR